MRVSGPVRALVILAGGIILGVGAYSVGGGGEQVSAELDPLSATTTSTAAPTTTPVATSTIAPTTTTTTTTTPPRGPLVIHGTGDVNTDSSYIPALAANGHSYAWEGLDGLFVEDDLTVINLECTPSELGTPLPKQFVFRCDLDSLRAMRDAGVDVVNLANNHSRDHGPEALLDGVVQLERVGLMAVGVGANAVEAAAPALVEINGWTVAVVGFGGVVPSRDWIATEDSPGMADGDTTELMVETVRAAKELADLVIVTVHWGVELDLEPRPDDRERAEAMIEAGADAIFGHHAHRLQPLEFIDGKPVAWGLGNFVWPNFSVPGSTTAVARVVVSPEGDIDACLIPAFITAPGRPELTDDPPC
jgi:hypothetical protein